MLVPPLVPDCLLVVEVLDLGPKRLDLLGLLVDGARGLALAYVQAAAEVPLGVVQFDPSRSEIALDVLRAVSVDVVPLGDRRPQVGVGEAVDVPAPVGM